MCAELESVGKHSIFGDLHLQISKTQNGHQNTFLYSLSHMKAQFMFSARFLIDNFFVVSLERNYLYLTFKSKVSARFSVFTATKSILLNKLTRISRILVTY